MGGQEMIIMLMMLLFGKEGGNEALDYVDSKSYWGMQEIEMTSENLMRELEKPTLKKESKPKAAEIRRLLAIRGLGELKSEKALDVLVKYAESRELFVSDYAHEAIAAIKGEAAPKIDRHKEMLGDLAVFPKNAGVVMQAKMFDGPPVDLSGIVTELSKEMELSKINAMLEGMQGGLINFLETTGNIRIDGLSVGIADNVGDEAGWVGFHVRGAYDSKGMKSAISQLIGEEFEVKKSGDVEYMMLDESVMFAFLSDNRCLLLIGPDLESTSYKVVSERVSSTVKEPAFSAELKALVKKTETSGAFWLAGLVTENMKQAPYISTFNSFLLETASKGKHMDIELRATGSDEDEVQKIMDDLEKLYGDFVEQKLPDMKDGPEQLKPVIEFLESLEFRVRGNEGIIHGRIEEVNPLMLLGGTFFGAYAVDEIDVEE